MSKKRIMIGSRMYERMQMFVGDEEGRRLALKDAQAWRDRRYWATIRKGKDVSIHRDYPAIYIGPVWVVYKSIKKKEQ